ncbi:hypothetical protein [Mesorhizobium huakuii]|uniref:DUF1640 domain-containing protein n=1 Tax=Mesorhizobium huakuii TaxID=28104 RepID=A0A7G6T2B7_9HYPH|nr:hypothetical protein [Mesorhizobium huakuii]QND60899.1 hypothetical protein HB778_33755 [Mesorhizobium huakuii]
MVEPYARLVPSNENHELGAQAFESGDGGGTYDPVEQRVKALEDAIIDIKVTLARLDERANALATKEDVSALGKDISGLRGEMKGTLGFWQFLIVFGGVLALVLRWPELFRLAGISTP